jgi:nucleoid-associated protein YgaU
MGKSWHGLPVGVWFGLAGLGAGLAWFLYKKHKADSAATTAATATTASTASTDTGGSGGMDTGQYESLVALLQDIQGEVSTSTPAGTTVTGSPTTVVQPIGPVSTTTPMQLPPISTPVAPTPTANTYTVMPNDSLFTIAAKRLGSGADWTQILGANKTVITNTALQHGATQSKAASGSLIYPGEVLVIP